MQFIKNIKLLLGMGLFLYVGIAFSGKWEDQGQSMMDSLNRFHQKAEAENNSDLIVCIEAGDLEGLKTGLNALGAKVNDIYETKNMTALMLAVSKGRKDMVELLLNKGADPHIITWSNNTALREAVKVARKDIVGMLVNIASANCRSSLGYALIEAVKVGDKNMVQLFLDKGADINIQGSADAGNSFGVTTPLIAAVASGREDMVKLLLDKKANPNKAEQMMDTTPLMVAVCMDNKNMVKLLLDKGANPQAKNIHGTTVLKFSKSAVISELITKAIK